MARPLEIAVLIKQIPSFEDFTLTTDGRLRRDGVPLGMNPYCRRAVTKGIELARESSGYCTIFTLGPESASEVLREAIVCGAGSGILVSDNAFAGSDTLATARALAAAVKREGIFDVILVGRNSVDAETGQVGPALAELLGFPFLCAVRELIVTNGRLRARCERDDGWAEAEVAPPAVLAVAERLCAPAKAAPDACRAVSANRIRVVTATELGPGPWGIAGSLTRVGEVRATTTARDGRILTGPLAQQVSEMASFLRDRGVLDDSPRQLSGQVSATSREGESTVAALLESGRERLNRELCGGAARLAAEIGGKVAALSAFPGNAGRLGSWGADENVVFAGPADSEDFVVAAGEWARAAAPWAILAPGTLWGREVAGRLAARLKAGLTGDAIDLTVENRRLIAWKPAFGGQCVAAIHASSAIQMATVRPGALALLNPRKAVANVTRHTVTGRGRIKTLAEERDDDIDILANAEVVVGVGTGVAPEDYGALDPLTRGLGAALAATRKVTDRGWLPRARQLGITGIAIAPRLYFAIGLSGKFNHSVGIRGAGMVVAINDDPEAPIFNFSDIGIVADWKQVVPPLAVALAANPQS